LYVCLYFAPHPMQCKTGMLACAKNTKQKKDCPPN
jgi:hypothetical protein